MRMNISFPDRIGEKMRPFNDQVNWSAIAATAFEREADRLAELANIGDEVKRRLRQTEIEDGESVEESAKKLGCEWAKHHARMMHLRRLSAASEQISGANWTLAMLATWALNSKEARWEDLPGVPSHRDEASLETDWATGFYQGAMEVYDAL